MPGDISLIALLTFATLLPFLIASGTCFVKFSIVFVIIRNALGLQQVPSNMTINGIALLLAVFVMSPIAKQIYEYTKGAHVDFTNEQSITDFVENGLMPYTAYLRKYADPELVKFFEKAQQASEKQEDNHQSVIDMDGFVDTNSPSIFALLPAYALTEIKSAFTIGFYIYLPFVVVDLVISSILLALGMMMMSPVSISVPIKLVLFVALNGWGLISQGLITQYLDILK